MASVARCKCVDRPGRGRQVARSATQLRDPCERPERCDVRRYVRSLTEVMRSIAAAHGISAGEVAGLVGLWVDLDRPASFSADREDARLAKLGAIGVRIAQWVTSHGFALNLTTAP